MEIIVRSCEAEQESRAGYPLRSKALRYIDPFDRVAEGDWSTLR